MNGMESYTIECPNCKVTIQVPFIRALEAKAIEDADMAEITARQELGLLKSWLNSASLWEVLKWYLSGKKSG